MMNGVKENRKFRVICEACGSEDVDVFVVVPVEEVRIECYNCRNAAQGHNLEDMAKRS